MTPTTIDENKPVGTVVGTLTPIDQDVGDNYTYELVTGAPPFSGDSPVAVAYQHVREDPKTPSEVNPAVPAALDAITLKALAKNPFNRYQTAGEMRDDLIRALQGEPVEAPLVMSADERWMSPGRGGP